MFRFILPKMTLGIEKWKWNSEYRVYVSNMGHFKDEYKDNLPFNTTSSGYLNVKTRCGYKLAHRLVMITWRPCPGAEDLTVDHLDHNKRNNALSNLEWVTREENWRRAEEDQLKDDEADLPKGITPKSQPKKKKKKPCIIRDGSVKHFGTPGAAVDWVMANLTEVANNPNTDRNYLKKKIKSAAKENKLYLGFRWELDSIQVKKEEKIEELEKEEEKEDMTHYYAIGDLHGDFKAVRNFTQRHIQLHRDVAAGDENVLICLGDFGANYFMNTRDWTFKHKLGKYPFTYFVIRGNHEERPSVVAEYNIDKWHTEDYFGNKVWVEDEFPYIKYALDCPAVYDIAGARTLVLPGAYSVDKLRRLQNGWSWFAGEQMTETERNIAKQICVDYGHKFDLVLSHTCPLIFEPTDLFLSVVDQSTVDKTTERFLGELEFEMDYKLWLWGHYHADRLYPETGDGQRVMLFQQVLSLDKWLDGNPVGYGEFI